MGEQRILIVGGTAAIGEHLARQFAKEGASLFITGRNTERLVHIAADLEIRGAKKVFHQHLDVEDDPGSNNIVQSAADALGGLDAVVYAAGLLPDQSTLEHDADLLRRTMEVNAVGGMIIMNQAAAYFENQRNGQLVAIGSVAGDRGRAVNCGYGAAKGALETYLSGLRQRLNGSNVHVLLVKPGFVDTPMTGEFEKGLLWVGPDRVARDIASAMKRRRTTLYTPWFWRWIMLVIKSIPESLFVRLRF